MANKQKSTKLIFCLFWNLHAAKCGALVCSIFVYANLNERGSNNKSNDNNNKNNDSIAF